MTSEEQTSPIAVPASKPIAPMTSEAPPTQPQEQTSTVTGIPASEPLIPKSETMGFTCTLKFFRNLIRMISLEKFPEIVLHFDGEKVWWSNKANGVGVSNFGFFSYNFIEKCWGKGTVGLPSSILLDYVKLLHKYKKITFWTEPENKIFFVRPGDIDGKFATTIISDIYYKYKIPVENIKTARYELIKLDTDYIPVVPSIFGENGKLKYGFDIDIFWIKSFVERAQEYHNHISIALSPDVPEIEVDFNSSIDKNEIHLGPKSELYTKFLKNISNLKLPPKKTVYVIKADSLKSIAENFPHREDVSFRVSNIDFHPIYLFYKKTNENDKSFLVSAVFVETLNRAISIAEDKRARSEYLRNVK